MVQHQYIARIKLEDAVVKTFSGDDIEKLQAHLMQSLEDECTNARGEIVNNDSGELVYQCRKQCFE